MLILVQRANENRKVKISNSDFLNGLTVNEAINLSIVKLEGEGLWKRDNQLQT
jgi:hypothetical protein